MDDEEIQIMLRALYLSEAEIHDLRITQDPKQGEMAIALFDTMKEGTAVIICFGGQRMILRGEHRHAVFQMLERAFERDAD